MQLRMLWLLYYYRWTEGGECIRRTQYERDGEDAAMAGGDVLVVRHYFDESNKSKADDKVDESKKAMNYKSNVGASTTRRVFR